MNQQKDDEIWVRTMVAFRRLGLVIKFTVFPFVETLRGALLIGTFNSQSFLLCILATAIPYSLNKFGFDFKILTALGLSAIYPRSARWISDYREFLFIYPYWLWGLYYMAKRERRKQKIQVAFENAGIKTKGDRYPHLIYDKSITPETYEMKFRKNGTNIDQFRNGRTSFESTAQIYIDTIRDNIQYGTIDIAYGLSPLVSEYEFEEDYLHHRPNTLLIGKGRAGYHVTNLITHPHLLIAGVSGAGKSTLLRSMIATLIRNNRDYKLHVIDLKGGIEFRALLEGVKRTTVKSKTPEAIATLKELREKLDSRMSFLEKNKYTDIAKYFKKVPLEKRIAETPDVAFREVVIVDECADLFLRGPHITQDDMQTAREVLSRIARMGRAVGIHLIMATQRPDTGAIDSQVKSNLSGVIAFRAANLATSMTILGNARATEIPAEIKGRSIWKAEGEYFEVQTPHLSSERAASLLDEFRSSVSPVNEIVESRSMNESQNTETEVNFDLS